MMMTDWYQKSMNALALNGKAGRTQEAYSRALRMLCEFYGNKAPEDISETELEAYFLHRRNVDHWSANTLRICYCGIRFYFVKVLQRDWNLFNILRAKSESRLPAVLSREEVRAVLGCVRTPHNRAYLTTVYACGLRLQEALYLEVSDIDADRMMIHVHRGKGAKDRFVPLPKATLDTLRQHWRRHRHPRLLFPAYGRDSRSAASATQPMAISSVQGAFRAAKAAGRDYQEGGVGSHACDTAMPPICSRPASTCAHPAVPGALQPGDDHGLSAPDQQGPGRRARAHQHAHGGSVTWAPFRRFSAGTHRRIGHSSAKRCRRPTRGSSRRSSTAAARAVWLDPVSVRGLRRAACRRTLLRQPPLSGLPAGQGRAVALPPTAASLQHVLPAEFMKVRYFGFLSPSFSMPIEELKGRIELAQGFALRAPQDAPAEVSTPRPAIVLYTVRWEAALVLRGVAATALRLFLAGRAGESCSTPQK